MTGPGGAEAADAVPTVKVRRGDLAVTVREGGAIYAMKPLEIKNEVEGWSTILEAVDEGTQITEEDVANGKVLIQLDSSELEESVESQRISVFQSEASLAQARENLLIQRMQNESDIATAELNLRFARLEFERYVGSELAAEIYADGPEFRSLASHPKLGGTALQTLRTMDSDVLLSEQTLVRNAEELRWTRDLCEREYVSRDELEKDELAYKTSLVDRDAAQESVRLFRVYTLPKEAEERYSDVQERDRDLSRIRARARSWLAQQTANLDSNERKYKLEVERLQKLEGMIEKCTIRAPKAGQVAYGSSEGGAWGSNVRIAPGSSVQEGKVLLRIPDLSSLAVRVNIKEKDIETVRRGQPAIITVEALPDRKLPGRVVGISPMASATHARLNPDSKVYETEVMLDEPPARFIPGMSAVAEIVIAQLTDVVYVPVPAV
ncbi:MAG: efflux RND transporter periplasmic adaptor subunit, partial [Candidatus Eisenbacteria bacterium]|nr:efflux RND transporter periplasmic adaptor subunit [Candidatus Eisenbacteria bacterium]